MNIYINITKRIISVLSSLCLFVMCFCMLSCDDKLSELPSQSKVDGTLVVDEPSALVALRGFYYSYAMCGEDYNGTKTTKCTKQYEVRPADFAGTIIYTYGAYQLETHNPSSLALANAWQSLYTIVNAANCVIKQIDDAPDDVFSGNKKAQFLGEARCMRAYANYNVMKYYAYYWDINSPYGIIVRDEPCTVTNLPAKRNSVKETYDHILADLDYAIANAPETNDKCFANKWVAMGLKARVLMMRGQGNDYAEAASLTKDIIEKGPYTLEENVIDVFHTKGLNSCEAMFGVQPKSGQVDVYEGWIMHSYPSDAPQYLVTDNLLALFKDDPRKDKIFHVTQKTSYVFDEAGNMNIVVSQVYGVNKHLVPGTWAASAIEENQIHMRLTEMYLLRAEALVRQNQLDEARRLLKAVLSHAGYTDFSMVDNAQSQHDMLQQVFNEYLRNLFAESGREMDIMMRYPKDIVLAFNPAYADDKFNVFPLPVEEFQYNNMLTHADQNPGYESE